MEESNVLFSIDFPKEKNEVLWLYGFYWFLLFCSVISVLVMVPGFVFTGSIMAALLSVPNIVIIYFEFKYRLSRRLLLRYKGLDTE